MSFFTKLKERFSPKAYDEGLAETEKKFGHGLKKLLGLTPVVDDAFYQSLSNVLIDSDVGQKTTQSLIQTIRKTKPETPQEALDILGETVLQLFNTPSPSVKESLEIVVMVGVNGSGKTTTSAKLAYRYKQDGKKVLLVAADTFRAAAVAQLKEWASRVDVECSYGKENADPASVVVDACRKALTETFDVLIIDTAGRLENKVNLMNELEKIHRVIEKTVGFAAQKVYLVLDASTGQHALTQALAFVEKVNVNGLICTKMDGSAKGGSLISIAQQLKLPVMYLGLGEKLENLVEFDAQAYLHAITLELDDVG